MSQITSESDNVFSDLGFDHSEAVNLKMRSDLMIMVEQYISENGLTQQIAAK